MQIHRLLEIVYILLDKKTVTARELSERFEVSQRTIYRDVDALGAAGIPVYTTKGKCGGIGLLDTFVLSKSLLTEKEQIDILSSLQGLQALNVPDVEQVLKKLSVLFNKNNPNWIDVDFSMWGSDASDRENFDRLKQAILESKMITFDYTSSEGARSTRTVEPIQIQFKDKFWYLKAYCTDKQDFRIFKIGRMKNIQVTRSTFTRKLQKQETVSFSKEKTISIILKFSPAIAHRIYDEFNPESIAANTDGSFIVTLNFPETEWVYGFIMSFGAMCEVLEPPHIREIIHIRFAEACQVYL